MHTIKNKSQMEGTSEWVSFPLAGVIPLMQRAAKDIQSIHICCEPIYGTIDELSLPLCSTRANALAWPVNV